MSQKKRYDLSKLEKISGGKEEFIIEMIETFIKNAPVSLDKMDLYLSQKRYDALHKEAHRFIPGFTFLGVDEIKNDLELIEEISKSKQETEKLPQLLSKVKEDVYLLIEDFFQDFKLI